MKKYYIDFYLVYSRIFFLVWMNGSSCYLFIKQRRFEHLKRFVKTDLKMYSLEFQQKLEIHKSFLRLCRKKSKKGFHLNLNIRQHQCNLIKKTPRAFKYFPASFEICDVVFHTFIEKICKKYRLHRLIILTFGLKFDYKNYMIAKTNFLLD